MKVFLLLSSVLLAVHLAHSTPLGACPATNPEIDVRLADSDNCHIFYKCDWGEPVLFECPSDLVFNSLTRDCDYPYNVNCDHSGVVVPEIPDDGTATGPLFDCPEVDGKYAMYIPDKTDCSVYYACAHGIAYQMKCADGLYYDGTIWACTYRESATCFTYHPIEDGSTNSGEDPEGDGNQGAGPVGSCPQENTPGINVLLPDAENCAMYYLCDWGVPVAFNCPASLHYNPTTAQCDYPENVNCDGSGVVIPGNPDDGTATGPLFDCPEVDGKYAVYIPDKTDCSVYYACAHGIAHQMKCADGLYYDGTIWACTYPESATCFTYHPIEDGSTNSGEDPEGDGNQGAGPVGSCPQENTPGINVLLPDAENCAMYYLCDWGVPVAFNCPASLHYNPTTAQCDYPENVNCDGSGVVIPGNPGGGDATGPLIECPEVDGKYATYIPDKTDCSVYYICDHGVALQMTCADGLYYDGTIWACTFPDVANCGQYRPIEWEDEENPDEEDNEIPDVPVGGVIGECPAENTPDVDVLLPDSDNCGVFYKCDWGEPVLFVCPDDLHFSVEENKCDHPDNVNCVRDGIAPLPENPDEEDNEIPDVPVGGVIGECPAENTPDVDVLLPDSENCGVFYKCDWGEPVLFVCPDDLHFNVEENKCDHPDNVNCVRDGIAPLPENPDEEDNEIPDVPVGGVIGECPAENTPGLDVLLPDSENCGVFWKCDWGEPVLFVCPDDLLFSVEENECDHPDNVNCDRDAIAPLPEIPVGSGEESSGEESGSGSGPAAACPAIDGIYATYIPDKTDCSIYYACAHGHAYEMRCPDNLYFDSRIWACVLQDQAYCGVFIPDGNGEGSNEEENIETPDVPVGGVIGECPAENTPEVDVLLPDSENCGVFYKCDWGVPVLFVCPDDLLFNVQADKCDHPDNVNCDRSVVVEPEPEVPIVNLPEGDGAWVGDCPVEVVEHDVFLAHRDNPHKFYVCVGSTPVELICPSNLVFDVSQQLCDYA